MSSKRCLLLLPLFCIHVCAAFTLPNSSTRILPLNYSSSLDKAISTRPSQLTLSPIIKRSGAESHGFRRGHKTRLHGTNAIGTNPIASDTVNAILTEGWTKVSPHEIAAQSALPVQVTSLNDKIRILLSNFYSKFAFSAVATWHGVKTRSLQALRKTNRVQTILVGTLLFASLYLSIDTVLTKKRQWSDATSEWGRYADHPSVRGRALFGLIGRISFLLLWARVVNTILPGGEYAFMRRKSKSNKDKQNLSWAAMKAARIRTTAGATFSEGLLRLGPLYIKIGQILSCRDNLLPDEWKESMERLQDRVPAKSGEEALKLAYSAYDGGKKEFDSLFSDFDDVPLAAASLGQVHLATLRSNNVKVAIKLQRPRLRDIYDKDLALMNTIAKSVDRFGGKAGAVGGVKQSWEGIFQDAEEILYREIDYRAEAENALKFASDFGLGVDGKSVSSSAKSLDGKFLPSAASWVRTPYVYSDVSNERSLVMEFVPSIKISDNAKLARAGVTEDEKEYLAECLGRAYLRQFCCGKFFSTDPHAGNLGAIVKRDENGNKQSVQLVFYDFGQACYLKDDQAGGILDVIEGIIDYDADKCVNAFQRMGVLSDGADLEKVKRKVNDNFQTGKIKVKQRKMKKKGQTGSLKEGNTAGNTSPDDTLVNATLAGIQNNTMTNSSATGDKEKINDAEIMSYFTLPAEYAFVARAISQMDGVGKGLDGDFDFISAAAPWLVEIKGGEKFLEDEAKKIVSNVFKRVLDFQNKVLKRAGFQPEKYMTPIRIPGSKSIGKENTTF